MQSLSITRGFLLLLEREKGAVSFGDCHKYLYYIKKIKILESPLKALCAVGSFGMSKNKWTLHDLKVKDMQMQNQPVHRLSDRPFLCENFVRFTVLFRHYSSATVGPCSSGSKPNKTKLRVVFIIRNY